MLLSWALPIVENSMKKLWTIAVDKQFMYKGFYSIANECKRQTQLHQHRRGKKYIIQTIEAVKCIRNTHTYAPPSLYPTHTHHLANGSASRSTLIRTISHSALSLSNRRPCRMSSDFFYFFSHRMSAMLSILPLWLLIFYSFWILIVFFQHSNICFKWPLNCFIIKYTLFMRE